MKINILKFSLILFFLTVLSVNAKEPMYVMHGTVIKVLDGDTIHLLDDSGQMKTTVRFYGMDAPEAEKVNKKTSKISKAGQHHGIEAQAALHDKIISKTVRVEVINVDFYQRKVGIVWLEETNINAEMVREGHAWAYRQYLDRPHASEYIDAETVAREGGLGLWATPNPQPPWEFRKAEKQ